MVWSLERDAGPPPLSVILPRLYLGAERDVTQERLASLGISYVLSVSRCTPQPTFLPCSRYLRVPIDDSLWDDLLPWIPKALHFIDAALSAGGSVLVHCAAGISRSPALAVAYVMYRLEMDLDHAYRFVKERRPSISPNFNFLGQLQLFQAALSHRTSGGDFLTQQQSDQPASVSGRATGSSAQSQAQRPTGDSSQQRHSSPDHMEDADQRLWRPDPSLHQREQEPPSVPCDAPKPTKPPLPPASASLSEKRKSLTLSLTPPGTCPSSLTGQHSKAPATSKAVPVQNCEGKGSSQADVWGHSGPQRPSGDPCRGRGPPKSQCGGAEMKEQGLLWPFSMTLSKLLDWGDRLLLGGLFVTPVRTGRPTLPYEC
ncbi:dual specificity protein phosphatase 8 [Oryzias latipes]|uniref:dual specificity protein phosphatase 8 n=1 Tax=Oryzias latipes TaxID=8090 RepID=UPI0002A4B940|nr:dual specificity protein phosphatase 8 [Oryzias latipes]XP_020561216.1 dual specificity protein phosphatase 8 [Oryzias latipes]